MNILTVRDLLQDYTTSRSYLSLASSTRKIYQAGLNKLLDDFGALFKLEDMTPRNAVRFYNDLLDDYNATYSASLLKGPKAAFQTLVDLREAEINPFALINMKLRYDPRAVVWSKDEVEKFCQYAKRSGKYAYLYPFVTMLYESAQRPEDVRLILSASAQYSIDHKAAFYEIEQQKTGTKVTIWHTKKVNEALEHSLEHKYLFHKNGEHVSLQTFRKDFKLVIEISGLRPELQMRDLRRSRVTHLIDAGHTSEQVMSLTGHPGGAPTRRRAGSCRNYSSGETVLIK